MPGRDRRRVPPPLTHRGGRIPGAAPPGTAVVAKARLGRLLVSVAQGPPLAFSLPARPGPRRQSPVPEFEVLRRPPDGSGCVLPRLGRGGFSAGPGTGQPARPPAGHVHLHEPGAAGGLLELAGPSATGCVAAHNAVALAGRPPESLSGSTGKVLDVSAISRPARVFVTLASAFRDAGGVSDRHGA